MSFDDQPVGQHKKIDIPELPPDAPPQEVAPAPEKVGSLTERLASKNPKIRLDAFTELLKLFTEAKEKEPIFQEHYSHFIKYMSDSHPGAQEKAFEAFALLLQKCPPQIEQPLKDILNMIIEKGCSSAKTTTKAKAGDCIIGIAELENGQSIVVDAIKGYLAEKSTAPKIVASAIQVMTLLLNNFGNSVFPVKDIINSVASQTASTNASVRAEALNYFKEAYRWVKNGVLPAMETMRAAQQEELKKQFTEIVDKPVPTKSIKGKELKVEAGENLEERKDVKIDTYAAAEEVDVLNKYGETWCNEVMGLKKWSEKRDKLDELLRALSVDKVKNENFSELGQTLKKLLNDSNIVVVNCAIKVIGQLAKTLRENCANYSKFIFEHIVQKCKDKKTTGEAQKCLENMVFSLKMEEMVEAIKEALCDKSPLIKLRVCSWLEEFVLPKAGEAFAKSVISSFSSDLVKLTDDAASDVRDSALACIGVLQAIVNDTGLGKIIQEMNSQKQEKINKAGEKLGGISHPINPPKEEEKVEKQHNVKPEKPAVKKEVEEAKSAPKAQPKKKIVNKVVEMAEIKEEDIGQLITVEEATKQIEEILPPELFQSLDKSEWKERQKGLQDINEWTNNNIEKITGSLNGLVIWLKQKLKDFKESNQGVMKEGMVLLGNLASKCILSKQFASVVVPALIDKMADAKQAEVCTNLILAISDSASPNYVSTSVLKAAYGAKSVNTIKGTLALLGKMLEGYSPFLMPIKLTVDYAKQCLGNSNQQVRSTSIAYLGIVYSYIGEPLKQWVSNDLNEATYKTVEKELGKIQPKNKKEAKEIKRQLKGESEKEANKAKNEGDLADSLMPRVNISSQITTKIINGLQDNAMKKRQEAKDAIEKIIASANNRIQPNGLNQLFGALKARMSEPCKNLAKSFITLVGNLAESIGSGCKQYSKIIIPPLMLNLADKQNALRSETITAMNKFAEAAGSEIILNNAGPLLEKDNQEMRNELLTWILKNKESLNKADTNSLVVPLVASIQDRTKEIRVLTEQVVAEVLPIVGYTSFVNATQDLKPIVKTSLRQMLEKYKPINAESIKPVVAESAIIEKEEEKKQPATTEPEMRRKSVQITQENEANLIKEEKQDNEDQKRRLFQERAGSTAILPMKSPIKQIAGPVKQLTRTKTKTAIMQSPNKSQNSNNSGAGGLVLEISILTKLGNKEKRAEADKTVKWPVTEIREDLVEKLKKSLKSALHPTLFEYMFDTHFKKNLEAVKVLSDAIKNEFESMVDIMDLIFKWVLIKILDQSNTAMSKALINLLKSFLSSLTSAGKQMMDFEAAVILPMLCERIGGPTKEDMQELIRQTCSIYTPSKVMSHLVRALESKNQKTKLECLTVLKEFLIKYSSENFAIRDAKILAKLVNSNENPLRNGAADVLVEIYKSKKEYLWSYLAEVSEKNKEMLKARFSQIPQLASSFIKDIEINEKKENLNKSVSLQKEEHDAKNTTQIVEELPLQEIKQVEQSRTRNAAQNDKTNTELSTIRDFQFTATETINLFDQIQGHNVESTMCEEEKQQTLTSPINSQDLQKKEGVTIEKCLDMLKDADMATKVSALVALNEKATNFYEKEKFNLVSKCNQLFDSFTSVLKFIFEKPPHDIPLRFAKYFMTVLNKIASCRTVVKEVQEQKIYSLSDQLLANLLYEGLDKLGDNREGEHLIKLLNAAILRLLENCDPTAMLVSLINLFKAYKNQTAAKAYINTSKLPGLTVKCILKITKVIGSFIPSLDVKRLLLCLHEYLLSNPTSLTSKQPNDEIGTRIVKTLVNELVKAKGEAIWEDYKPVADHQKPDIHIKKWIGIILKSTHGPSAGKGETDTASKESPDELKEIFKGLQSQTTFHETIKALSEYMARHPSIDLQQYFINSSKGFSDYVISSLQKYNAMKSEGTSPIEKKIISKCPISPLGGEFGKAEMQSETKNNSSLSECRAKMAILKQKLGGKEAKTAEHQAVAYSTENIPTNTIHGDATAEIKNKINQFKALMSKVANK